jgi:hypothetical protein
LSKAYPKVYILILNWNGWKDTIECLESVFRNSYPNYQVVVIDNGSPNGSMEKIKEWANGEQEVLCPENSHSLPYSSAKKSIPYVYYSREEAEGGGNFKLEKEIFSNLHSTVSHPLILIQSGTNLGFAGGNNVGIRYALNRGNCDYILLLNNDTVVKKDFLVKLIAFMKSCSTAGVAGSKIINEKEGIDRACARRRPTILDYVFRLGIGRILFPNNRWIKKHYYMDEYDFKYPRKVDIISGACMLFKAEVLKKIGLFDENTFLYLEEFILHEKLRKTSWETWVVPESKIIHKGAKSTSLKTKSFMRKVELKSLAYYLKNYRKIPYIVIIILITYILLSNILATLKDLIFFKTVKYNENL